MTSFNTNELTNSRPVYILPLVNQKVCWPVIGHLYCMTSFFCWLYKLLLKYGFVKAGLLYKSLCMSVFLSYNLSGFCVFSTALTNLLTSLSLFHCLSVCLSAPFACLHVCLSVCLTVCLSVHLYVCLSICLSISLKTCLLVCLI